MLARSVKSTLRLSKNISNCNNIAIRSLQTTKADDLDTKTHVHFKKSPRPHPLGGAKTYTIEDRDYDIAIGDHTGRLQNHIWAKEEIKEKMGTLYHHKPVTFGDKVTNKLVFGLYNGFNWITGFDKENPTVKSFQWRLIILESIAGVPGFVAAGFRHFRSLRHIQRDHGWIATLLEEAENERMHLLLCIHMFQASKLTRTVVILAQIALTSSLMTTYLFNPKIMHRFVGYLEETACETYVSCIKHIETPGTHLNREWATLPAPPMAIGYYHLPHDALWLDTLKCMMADESHHRDVNHTFAEMKDDDPNPFIEMHKHNAAIAWRVNNEGVPAYTSPVEKVVVVKTTTEEEKK